MLPPLVSVIPINSDLATLATAREWARILSSMAYWSMSARHWAMEGRSSLICLNALLLSGTQFMHGINGNPGLIRWGELVNAMAEVEDMAMGVFGAIEQVLDALA